MSNETTEITEEREADSTDHTSTVQIRVDFRIEADASFDCPLVEVESEVETAHINAIGSRCSVDLFLSEEVAMVRSSGTVTNTCLCSTLSDVDAIPHIRRIKGRTIYVTTFLDDRSDLSELISTLKNTVGTVHLDRLSILEGTEKIEQAVIDLSQLTTKQRDALDLAVRRGYFDGETTLGELAEEFEITKSALSQRLRSGQAKLIRSIFESKTRDGDG